MACRRANGRAHYRLSRQYYLAKARKRNVRTAKRVRDWLLDYLVQHPCVDCGLRDVRVLEFDHRDPEAKRAEISVLAATGYSLAAVQAEVRLCDVRCANCHIIRTRSQLGWWRGG